MLKRKSAKNCTFPLLEAEVVKFLILCRQLNIPITRDLIRLRAEMQRDSLLLSDTTPQELRTKLQNFTVSEGWCTNFLKRNNLKSKVLHGQAASVDIQNAKAEMITVRNQLTRFPIHNIFNVDETALFYRLLPRRSYVFQDEDNGNLRGTRQMSCKDRVTALLCASADGSIKIPLTIIGVSENPRAFKKEKPPCFYFNSKKAWSNGFLFQKWIDEVFQPYVSEHTSGQVALLVDNASSHNNLAVPEKIELIRLPPNVTSVHQPMDMGIIRSWKARYRRLMLRGIIQSIELRLNCPHAGKGNKSGTNGLSNGYHANMLDVCTLSKKAWETVSSTSIARCWVRAHCLPCAVEARMVQDFGRAKTKFSACEQSEIVNLFRRLHLSDRHGASDGTTFQQFEECVSVEDSETGRFAIACSIYDDTDSGVDEVETIGRLQNKANQVCAQ